MALSMPDRRRRRRIRMMRALSIRQTYAELIPSTYARSRLCAGSRRWSTAAGRRGSSFSRRGGFEQLKADDVIHRDEAEIVHDARVRPIRARDVERHVGDEGEAGGLHVNGRPVAEGRVRASAVLRRLI